MTRLTEALRSEWLAMLLLVACLIGLGVLGVMAPDGRSRSGQAVVPSGSSQQAVSPVPASILNAGDE